MSLNAQMVEEIVREVLSGQNNAEHNTVPVGVSARHVHLCPYALERLFGKDAELEPFKPLMGGQFAAKQQVTIVGAGLRSIEKVRVLGPLRKETQVEISRTDTFVLGIKPPVRPSGDTENTPGITLVGPKGSVTIKKGCIIANRHIHMSPKDALRFGVQDGERVDCSMQGERKTLFYDVQVRVAESFTLEMHIDTDDANSIGFVGTPTARIIK